MFRSSAPAGRGSSAKGHTFFPLNEAAKWPPHGQASRETRDPCIAPYRIRGASLPEPMKKPPPRDDERNTPLAWAWDFLEIHDFLSQQAKQGVGELFVLLTIPFRNVRKI